MAKSGFDVWRQILSKGRCGHIFQSCIPSVNFADTTLSGSKCMNPIRGLALSCLAKHALAQQLTLMSCTRQRPCMRLMSPTDAKKRISVIAWRRSPSRNSSCALALIASSLNSLPSCFRSNSFTTLCFPFSASCHHILSCQCRVWPASAMYCVLRKNGPGKPSRC